MKKSEFRECDTYAARIAALRPFPKETLKSLREYYRVGLTYTSNALEGNSLTESETKVVIEDGLTIGGKPLKELLRLMGQSIALDDERVKHANDEGVNEGVNALLDVIATYRGKRANNLATLIGKSVQTVERYVRTLKDSGKIEFRGAPKNGGYFAI